MKCQNMSEFMLQLKWAHLLNWFDYFQLLDPLFQNYFTIIYIPVRNKDIRMII